MPRLTIDPRLRRRLLQVLLGLLALSIVVVVWMVAPYWELIDQFGQAPSRQPSRLYGRNPVLQKGMELSEERLLALLESVGYFREHPDAASPRRGFYRQIEGGTIEVGRRRFPTPKGFVGNDVLKLILRDGVLLAAATDGRAIPEAFLDPPLLASYVGKDLRERFHTPIDELPEHLIWSVLAAEDTNFLQHAGVSVLGIARAAWANLTAGELRQGGSTLTQQLVKNIFLTHERTARRKVREAMLALLIDWRYEKREILDAYLNEIYWGKAGSVNIMGVGAAARAYFGKEPSQLTLAESACLAGMIQSPANLSPRAHPEAAKKRRDAILMRLAELRWITVEQAEAALVEPIKPVKARYETRHVPYFSAFAAEEARARFGVQALEDAGYALLSTLSHDDQEAAEAAARIGIAEIEKNLQKSSKAKIAPLQVALVSLDPKTGGILAYVGGRNFQQSQFDRVAKARRQAGSAFKPIVFAAAFERKVATPATFLEDAPYTLALPSGPWSPQNNDDEYRGWVTVRTTLENSLNVPTARLAVDMGIEHVVDMAGRLGIASKLEPFPALSLGAMEVSPLELAGVYATLAAGGMRHPPHGLVTVFDRQGQVVPGAPLKAERALGADVAFVLNKTLQGVVEQGTAATLKELGVKDPIAGKTGTTNSRRDNWFAAYSPERATLVWVGYDDNAKTRLSGSKAALPIFARFGAAVRPPRGFSDFRMPDGVVATWIDPRTGGLADEHCSQRRLEFFLAAAVPSPACADERGSWDRLRPRTGRDDGKHPFRRWLNMVRGDGN
jgi:penicillin-binding protein 1B